MTQLKSVAPNARAEAYWNQLRTLLAEELGAPDRLSNTAILALVSQYLGLILAMQDQRAHTKDEYLDLIIRNIETGNQTYIEMIFGDIISTADDSDGKKSGH